MQETNNSVAESVFPARPSFTSSSLANMGRISLWGASNAFVFAPQLKELGARYGAATYMAGISGDNYLHIAARLGAIPAQVAVPGGVINGAMGAITTIIPNNPGLVEPTLRHFAQTGRRVFGWLKSTYGYVRPTDRPTHFEFVCGSPAPDLPVSSNIVPFTLEDGVRHRSDVTILAFGNNDLIFGWDIKGCMRIIDACYDWLSPPNPRCLIHNLFAWPGPPDSSPWRDKVLAMNAHLGERYGELVVDVYNLTLNAAIWDNPRIAAAGITPTEADLEWQAQGVCPPSLLSDGSHFNEVANNMLLDLTIEKIDSLGWYS